ncbi:MAG TPA: hypothetical protein VEY33_08730 [Gemmatimonadota bacterium]|nr:hypothetical protein [Gemmatimonadota bacterium]
MAFLRDVQRLFERTYDREAGVDLEACVVGPRRCAELASRSDADHPEMSGWARFFYYVEDANLRLALFYADEMIEALETRDPRRGLSESNVLPLLVFTEEASHALHTTFAFGDGGPSRVAGIEFLAELELMARIDAYLLLRHFVRALARPFCGSDLVWVRQQALTRWDVPYDDPDLAERYRGAARLATAFVDRLEAAPPGRRLAQLRSFRALPMSQKRARLPTSEV